MDQYSTASWTAVFSALVGASAALTGLLFVALSINLSQVIKGPGLIGRAIEVLVLLTSVLVVSTMLLIPGQGPGTTGVEILAVALVEIVFLGVIHVRAPRKALGVSPPMFAMRVSAAQASPLLMAVGGISLLVQNGGGLDWIVPAMVVAMVTAIIGAWVMLVEIVR
jgi:modulator of FtsH protease